MQSPTYACGEVGGVPYERAGAILQPTKNFRDFRSGARGLRSYHKVGDLAVLGYAVPAIEIGNCSKQALPLLLSPGLFRFNVKIDLGLHSFGIIGVVALRSDRQNLGNSFQHARNRFAA